MKVSVIGGGPGGLYFALLAKKAWPRWDITVYERNRPDDTFGFGVVFSDQTLDSFKAYDVPSYEMIRRRFAYWGDVDVVPGQIEDAFAKIERVIDAVYAIGALPLTMGGDGAGKAFSFDLTLPPAAFTGAGAVIQKMMGAGMMGPR